MRVFLIISSGQNIASLLPALEEYQDNDHILWINSQQAHAQGWTRNAIEFLREIRCIPEPHIHEINYTHGTISLINALRLWLLEHPHIEIINWIGNGGTKVQVLAVAELFRNRNLPFRVLYNRPYPAQLEIYENGFQEPPQKRPYHRFRVSLDDVLAISGYRRVRTESRTKRVWPSPSDDPTPAGMYLPPHDEIRGRLSDDLWGQFRNFWHNLHQFRTLSNIVAHEDIATHPRLTRHAHRLLSILQHAAPLPGEVFLEDVLEFCKSAYQRWWQKVAEKQHRLDEESIQATLTRMFIDIVNHAFHFWSYRTDNNDTEEAGELFERAVSHRFVQWLRSQPENLQSTITEVWTNVKITREDDDNILQEFDLIGVTTSGVVFQMESKSGKFQEQTLYAQLFKLYQASSFASEMGLVLPICPHEGENPRWEHAQRIPHITPIPYTPIRASRAHDIPSFEEALKRWLWKYAPSN